MKKSQILKSVIVLAVMIMLFSFLIFSDEAPRYYGIILFNVGLWSWLLAKRELKKAN